ncbi:helix-turn-helix domain-containing protein [Micromonospora chersina]|uniref:helix-turn-helix domain-containing protein n=1 Tax=Micromonospora chersina TaxID=47854 RepID=UPI0037882818
MQLRYNYRVYPTPDQQTALAGGEIVNSPSRFPDDSGRPWSVSYSSPASTS